MKQDKTKQAMTVVGIDLDKTWVQVWGQDASGRACLDRRMKPKALRAYLAKCSGPLHRHQAEIPVV